MTKKETDIAKEIFENLLKRLEQQGVKTSVVRRKNSEKIYITILKDDEKYENRRI